MCGLALKFCQPDTVEAHGLDEEYLDQWLFAEVVKYDILHHGPGLLWQNFQN